MGRTRKDRHADWPTAGRALTAARVLLLLIFAGFGVAVALRRQWFMVALTLWGCWGVVSAIRIGKAPKRLPEA